MEVYRGNVLALRVNSIGKAAKLTVDQGTTKFTQFSIPGHRRTEEFRVGELGW